MLKYFKSLILFILLAAFCSCKYDLISEPTINSTGNKNPADYNDYILPPQNVTATHGDYRKVTVSWTKLPNAVNYYVYSADTPFDEFIRIGETTDNSFIIEENPGTTKYYAVRAINYFSSMSFLSEKCTGSTLAKPIITKIDQVSDDEGNPTGKSVIVNWWMDNCSDDTYKNNVSFSIYTFLDNGKTKAPGIEPITLSSDNHSVTINGLTPKTDYYFSVQVVNTNDQFSNASESSDFTSISTAHNIYPKTPENFTAEQGSNLNEIVLTWELPEYTDYYDSKLGIYDERPVYFELSRRLLSEDSDESAFVTIADYIGINDVNTANSYSFNSSDCTTSNPEILSIEETAKYTDIVNSNYFKYIPFYIISFKDKTAQQNKKYQYKLQAFTDSTSANSKVPSSDSIQVTGWKLPKATFGFNSNIITDEDFEKITDIETEFQFDFLPFEREYIYQVSYTQTDFDNNPIQTKDLIKTSNIDEIKSLTLIFSDSITQEDDTHLFINDTNNGYYTFTLNILDPQNNDILSTTPAHGKITVTDKATLIPKIKDFSVQDGFNDKFILSWNYSEIGNKTGLNDETCLYTINWTSYDSNDNPISTAFYDIDFTADSLKLTDDEENHIIKFEHEAISNDRREYTLSVNTGLSTTATFERITETLGTAEPKVADADYSTINISWPKVQKADNYKINAYYTDDSTKKELIIDSEEEKNFTITQNEIEGKIVYTCTVSKPEGFDDARVSGKPISINIVSQNDTTNCNTTALASAHTMGPSLIESTKESISPNEIEIKWKKYKDADGYIIYRNLYSDKDCSSIQASDIYYINKEFKISTFNILDDGTYDFEETGDRVEISLESDSENSEIEYITLIDKQKDAESDSIYQRNQSMIKWGLPYGYIVLPIRKGGSFEDFVLDNSIISMSSNEISVAYKNLNITESSTFGYGLNVQASKATSATQIILSWEEPNKAAKNRTPHIFRKNLFVKNNSDKWVADKNATWEYISDVNLSSGALSCTIDIKKEDWDKPYEYAVQYGANSPNGLVQSYKDYLKTTKDDASLYPTGVEPEQKNKGYVLALGSFDAKYAGGQTEVGNSAYYQETLSWEDWSYETRTLGPDKYTFAIKNKNLSSTADWADLFTFNKDENKKYTLDISDSAHIIYDETTNSTANTAYDDTTVVLSNSVNNISLDPTGLTSGEKTNTDGLLKVLRDAKHYYSVKLTRGDGISVIQAEDEAVYAYRQISDEELAKCVSLIIADALYKTGIPDRKTYTTIGNTGEFALICSEGVTDANYVQWQFTNFTNEFINGFNSNDNRKNTSFITLSSTTSSTKKAGLHGRALYYLPELTIQVTSPIPLSSYSSSLTFSVGSEISVILGILTSSTKYNLTIKKGSTNIINIDNNKNQFAEWFPYDIGTAHENKDSTLNTSFKVYQSPWWN